MKELHSSDVYDDPAPYSQGIVHGDMIYLASVGVGFRMCSQSASGSGCVLSRRVDGDRLQFQSNIGSTIVAPTRDRYTTEQPVVRL